MNAISSSGSVDKSEKRSSLRKETLLPPLPEKTSVLYLS